MKIAIVCDTMSAYGGAERVIEQILKLYPSADVFSVLDVVPEGQRRFLGDRAIHSTFLQKIPRVARYYRKLLPLWPLAVEQIDVMAYDLIISTHHSVAYGILTRPGQVHASYVFSPARYAWDLQHEYLREAGLETGVQSLFARHTLHKIRLWDYAAAQRPDKMAACSRFVAERMWGVHKRQAEVIYPPVAPKTRPADTRRGDYYISVGRLVPYKRIELLARAFSEMPERKLKIVGAGPDAKKIAAACGPNVEMLGFRSDDEVHRLLAGARAYVFAGIEDFGITAVEAQALGTPVLAFNDGGLRETVVPLNEAEPTGMFFAHQTKEALIAAVDDFERSIDRFSVAACQRNAQRFSEEAFRDAFGEFVERALLTSARGRRGEMPAIANPSAPRFKPAAASYPARFPNSLGL
jgi:glycosyltransferase involved in cell wall biosynthesis